MSGVTSTKIVNQTSLSTKDLLRLFPHRPYRVFFFLFKHFVHVLNFFLHQHKA
uniref:Uncharacterized protein n=1 Tax=Oryza brachyantha TaxID=4533 RepID=J3LSI1_ORYBR